MKENSNKKSYSKAEIIFYILIAFVTVAVLLWYCIKPSQGNMVEVRVSGKVVGTYPLNINKTVTIEGKGNGKNVLIIRNGKVKIEEADCPDETCVKKGEVYRVSESIICLPNEVVVEIRRNDFKNNEKVSEQKEDDVDVIAK